MCTIRHTCVWYMNAMYPCIHLMWHPRHAHIYTSGLALLVHTVKGMCLPYRKGTDGTIGPQSSRSLSRVLSRFLSHAFSHTFLRNFSDALSLSCARGWLYGLARPHSKCVHARGRGWEGMHQSRRSVLALRPRENLSRVFGGAMSGSLHWST